MFILDSELLLFLDDKVRVISVLGLHRRRTVTIFKFIRFEHVRQVVGDHSHKDITYSRGIFLFVSPSKQRRIVSPHYTSVIGNLKK